MKIWWCLYGGLSTVCPTYTFDQGIPRFVAQNIYTGMGWGNAVGDVDFDGDDDFMIGAPFALEFQLKDADGNVSPF